MSYSLNSLKGAYIGDYYRGYKLEESLPSLGNNATVNPLDDYSYTPPYTPPNISLLLPH